jgi:hypothetical protein
LIHPPKTFKEANDWFYSTFDLNMLTFGDVNYTKLVQKAMHDGWMQGAQASFGLNHAKFAILKNHLRNFFRLRRSLNKRQSTSVLFFDSSRRFISRGGPNESFYGERWFDLFRKEEVDFHIHPEVIEKRKLGGKIVRELRLLNSLVSHCIQTLGSSHPLLPHLHAICFNYLLSYGMASDLLSEFRPKCIMITCHYGKEGLIRAAKENGVYVAELQHGIIDENDIFYCYPESVKEINQLALFPDSFFTFGQYWSALLTKFHEQNNVVTAGDYTFRVPAEFRTQKNRVLITTQTSMLNDYMSIIEWVANQVSMHHDWEVVVRHHPLENENNLSAYRELCSRYPFVRESVGCSLSEDFQEAMVHVSIYSTTLFDASRWPLKNYSIQNFGTSAAYAASILKTGIAEGIEIGDSMNLKGFNPTSLKQEGLVKADYFYSAFPDFSVIKEIEQWSA